MHQASLPFTISLLAAAALMVLLAVYGWRYRRTAFGPAYIGLMFCASLYAGGYALELASSTLAQMLVWNKVQYLGISFIPFFWILMTARYSGRDAWLSRVVVAALFSLSFFTLLFDVTNAYLHIFYKSVGVDASGPFPIIQLMKGPWYWVHIAYYVITLLAGALLLVDSFRRAAPQYRRQTAVILTAALLPGAGLFVYLAGLSPYNLDTTPMTLTVVAPVFAWGLFRYKIFELAPVAKERIFAGMRDAVVVLDDKNRVIDFNPAAARVLNGLSDRSIGQPMEDLVQPFPSLLELLRPDGRSEIFLSAAGPAERLFYRADLSPVTDRRNRPIGRILVLSDTTQQELLMEKLREMATTDELTGAFNRHHFMEVGRREISRAKRYGRPLSLLVLDLDFFKGINDTLGHEAGDRVLKATCDALKKVFRSEDVLGRHGGDEFVVLLPETSPDHAFGVAERLRATIARNAVKIAGDVSVTTTASFGVAGLANVGNESVEDVIRAADRAMYKAKEEGRNCVCRANV